MAEEAQFLQDMPRAIGSRAVRALELVRDSLALDYAGVDFGVDRSGRVVLYEANATMVLLRREAAGSQSAQAMAVERVFDAVARMLLRLSGVADMAVGCTLRD